MSGLLRTYVDMNTRKFERWLVWYCAIGLGCTAPVLDAMFPKPSWSGWSKFFQEEVYRLFKNWTRNDKAPGSMGQGAVFKRGRAYVEEIVVGMEADENITFAQPNPDNDIVDIWSLILKHGRIWVMYPSGKRRVVPLYGSDVRIRKLAKAIHRSARLSATR